MKKEEVEEEINLQDIINLSLKRRWVIISTFIIGIIVSLVATFFLSPVYQATAIIKNGIFPLYSTVVPIMENKEAELIIKSPKFLNPLIKQLKLKEEGEVIANHIEIENIDEKNYFKLRVSYGKKDVAVKLCRALANSYIKKGNSIYEQKLKFLKIQLEEIDKEIKLTQAQIEKIRSSTLSEKSTLSILLTQTIMENYQSYLRNLQREKADLELRLSQFGKFELISSPSKAILIKPNLKANLAIGSILGLIIGIFLAFFFEYLESQNKFLKFAKIIMKKEAVFRL